MSAIFNVFLSVISGCYINLKFLFFPLIFLPVAVLHCPFSGWTISTEVIAQSLMEFIRRGCRTADQRHFISAMANSALSPTQQKLSHWRLLSPLLHPALSASCHSPSSSILYPIVLIVHKTKPSPPNLQALPSSTTSGRNTSYGFLKLKREICRSWIFPPPQSRKA